VAIGKDILLTAASDVGRWDWMDGSMLNNERRNQWLAEVTVARLERVNFVLYKYSYDY